MAWSGDSPTVGRSLASPRFRVAPSLDADFNFNLQQGNVGPNQDKIGPRARFPDITLYPLIVCNPTQGSNNQFINPNCFDPHTAGSLGTGSIPYLPHPMFWNSDFGRDEEHQNHGAPDCRASAFDFMNHPYCRSQTAITT